MTTIIDIPDTPPATEPADRLLAAARTLAPELSARAEEIERLGTLPPDLVATVRTAGLFRVAQATAFGGAELPPAAIVEVLEELSRADGSAGWTIMIGNGAPAFASWLDPAVGRDLLGADADFTSACVFAPLGRGEALGDGRLTVGGRWPWASGSSHAEWFANGLFVFDGDAPRMIPGRGPDWRLAWFPASEAEVIDNWDVAGIRGTGSHDVAAEGITVAEEHTISPFFEPARQDGPLWRLPFFTLVGATIVGVPLGIARRALDEVAEVAMTKMRAGSFEPLGVDPSVQLDFARAEGGLLSARAFVLDVVDDIWTTALAGDVPTFEQRARFRLATQQAMAAATAAVDTAFALGGASAARSSHPLQRCLRDIHVVGQHIYFGAPASRAFAMTRFGIDEPSFMI